MKESHIKIISITLPSLSVLLFVLFYYNAKDTNNTESNYKLALKMHEEIPHSGASILLSSDVINNAIDRTRVSYLDIFNDKFSLPQTQLSHLIGELETEHKEIIYQHHSDGKKIGKVLELTPRYRIVLAAYLEKEASSLTTRDLIESNISSTGIYLLKTFASSDDLLLLLKENKLTSDYLQINNLKRIYGNRHHFNENSRDISNSKED